MAWAVVAGSAISLVGGYLLSDDHGAGAANQASTDAARQQAAIAQDQWDTYKSTYQPLEKAYVADAQNYDTEANRERAAGEASATTSEQFGKARDRLSRTPGLDPSSGAYASSIAGLDMGQAAADAVGQNAARNKVKDTGWARRTDALSLGKGLPAQAASTLGSAASIGLAQAQFGQNQANAEGASIGRLVNQGVNAWMKSSSGSPTFQQDPTVMTDAGGNLQFDP
ncbi:MAG: hypothetical protein V4631_20915 [Pseudomonadota bacterium]